MSKFFAFSNALTEALEVGAGVVIGSLVLALAWSAVVPAFIR